MIAAPLVMVPQVSLKTFSRRQVRTCCGPGPDYFFSDYSNAETIRI